MSDTTQTTPTKATARPWGRLIADKPQSSIPFYGDHGDCYLGVVNGDVEDTENEANAALICQAVNAFDDLVEALKIIAELPTERGAILGAILIEEKCREVLKKHNLE